MHKSICNIGHWFSIFNQTVKNLVDEEQVMYKQKECRDMNDVNRLPTYKEEVSQYTKKDAIHALLFFAFIMLISSVPFGPTGQIVNLAFVLMQFVFLFVLLKRKGQGLRSIGLHLIDWKKALAVGLVFVIVCLMLNEGLLPGLLGGWQIRPANVIIWAVVQVLIMAFYEDVFYVGYIQTRIYGLIKNDILAVLVGAIIFAVMHWPFLIRTAMTSGEGVGADFLGVLVFLTIAWIVWHVIYNTVFRRLRSIITVTLLHFSWNLSLGARGGLWVDSYENGFNEFLSTGIVYAMVLLIVLWILPQIKKHKEAK